MVILRGLYRPLTPQDTCFTRRINLFQQVLTIFSGNGAGIYWVGTIPEAQRSGLGTLCTRVATNAGFQNGASVVTLQASPYGEPIYLRLGYKTYDRLKWYLCPKAS